MTKKSVKKEVKKSNFSRGNVTGWVVAIIVIIAVCFGVYLLFNQHNVLLAPEGTAISECTTINESGSYYLNQSINAEGDCLILNVSNFLLDGQAYSLTGNIKSVYFSYSNYQVLEVSNVNIEGDVVAVVNMSSPQYGVSLTVVNSTVQNLFSSAGSSEGDLIRITNSTLDSVKSVVGWGGAGGQVEIIDSSVDSIFTGPDEGILGSGGDVLIFNSSVNNIDVSPSNFGDAVPGSVEVISASISDLNLVFSENGLSGKLEVNSSNITNFQFVNIADSTISNSQLVNVTCINCRNVTLVNITSSGSEGNGLEFIDSSEIYVYNSKFNDNFNDGLYLQNVSNSSFERIVANGNGFTGMYINSSEAVFFENVEANFNAIAPLGGWGAGVVIRDSSNIDIIKAYANCNGMDYAYTDRAGTIKGISAWRINNFHLENVNVNSNYHVSYGLDFNRLTNSTIINAVTSYQRGAQRMLAGLCVNPSGIGDVSWESNIFDYVTASYNNASGLCGETEGVFNNFKAEGNALDNVYLSEGVSEVPVNYGSGYKGNGADIDCNALKARFDSGEVFFRNDFLPYCGDGSCNNDETCSSCSSDCGACSTSNTKKSGGGGGGGGGPVIRVNQTNNNSNYVPFNDSDVVNQTSNVSGIGSNGLDGFDANSSGSNKLVVWIVVLAVLIAVVAVIIIYFLRMRANGGAGLAKQSSLMQSNNF